MYLFLSTSLCMDLGIGGDLYFRGVRNHPELPENLENISHEPGYAIVRTSRRDREDREKNSRILCSFDMKLR